MGARLHQGVPGDFGLRFESLRQHALAAGAPAKKPAARPEDDKFMQFMADMQQLGAIS